MGKNIQDKIRGSLIGGAVGDALGYPVEFMSYASIVHKYGAGGITSYELDGVSGKALVSDDTQMTLFTALGLLNAKRLGFPYSASICRAYAEWYYTQIGKHSKRFDDCWISRFPELNVARAPGCTCMSSLESIVNGREPNNSSKGCGGIMRTAPVALYGVVDGRMDIKDVVKLAADAAETTHQHPLGWLPSALEAHIIYRLIENGAPTVDDFKAYITEGYKALGEIYPEQVMHVAALKQLTDRALALVDSPSSDVENINVIGEGWTGDEAFAIAIYCTVKYFDDFEKAEIAAVNHKGDSDSTGAVTGNLLGAAVGYDALSQHFKDKLELHDIILHVADDLWRGETTEFHRTLFSESGEFIVDSNGKLLSFEPSAENPISLSEEKFHDFTCEFKNLATLIIPDGVVSLPKEFMSDYKITERIEFPPSLVYIGNYNPGPSVKEDESFVFAEAILPEVFVPKTVKMIGRCAFGNSYVKKMVFEDILSCPYARQFKGAEIGELVIPQAMWEEKGMTMVTSMLANNCCIHKLTFK